MTRAELEQCIGYEVIIHLPHADHMHAVLIGFDDGGRALVDDGSSYGQPRSALPENVTCLALVQRRWQVQHVSERMPAMDDRPACTCPVGAAVESCIVHGPGATP